MSAALARFASMRLPTAMSVRLSSSVAAQEHAEWLKKVATYKEVTPEFHNTLEFVLPTPVPLHQFEQSPVVIEVSVRNPEFMDQATKVAAPFRSLLTTSTTSITSPPPSPPPPSSFVAFTTTLVPDPHFVHALRPPTPPWHAASLSRRLEGSNQ
eukprot:CAMPEP_0197445582 /NCGR_PEP_ID=MMETSP1175-20131217/10766_1 /TAXON_ID=1003142 /ORGANISM="Triceratium dubium, Strain CCMP147" /LENGTH=153 /DNA_ID=CAMNT_0042976567 /DNA_START=39 /DNA_END=501 /DNA_ORIENTATION=+